MELSADVNQFSQRDQFGQPAKAINAESWYIGPIGSIGPLKSFTMTGEFAFIDWLRRRTPADPRVAIGPGDDCAAVCLAPDRPCLVTTDMLLEGSCFLLAETGPRRVGRKAMAANLSDIAAMAGQPLAAVVSVGLPRQGGMALARELDAGLREMADGFNVAIVGGDTNTWNGPLVISVTLLGQSTGRGAVTRSGAKPGDWLVVTGELGGSILGKHLDFTPRVKEAIALHAMSELHAMIDISDGLAGDVNHICEESRCGAVLWADKIPIADAARRMPDDRSPLDHALGDGEDFELVFAVAREEAMRLVTTQPVPGIKLVAIGECVPEGLWLQEGENRRPLAPLGYVHKMT
jgi:thiamine-monophosphate kinase